MHLAWPGTPTLWNEVTLLRPDATLRGCRINANHELYAMTREQLQLLREVAMPGPPAHPLAIAGASPVAEVPPMVGGIDVRPAPGGDR